jgi:Phospholipase_D-nuclease N-terminal
MSETFWESFFLFMIFLPLTLVWAMAIVDIFRRDDMGGWSKALWVVCVILIPFLGTLMYLLTQRREPVSYERLSVSANGDYRHTVEPSNGLSELGTLSDLHDRGKLTDSEFAAEKARVLGAGSSVPA